MSRPGDIGPRGIYLAKEVGQLAGVSGDTIGQWARHGYIRSSQSDAGILPRLYSFQDAAEAMVVHELLELDVQHEEIKEAIRTLREESDTSWPLTQAGIGAGAGAVVVKRRGRLYEVGKQRWQDFIERGDLRRIAVELSRGGWAVRALPDLQHVEVNPNLLSGRPVVRGTRVSAEKVARLAKNAAGRKVLSSDYGLSKAQIRDARRWWDEAHSFDLDA